MMNKLLGLLAALLLAATLPGTASAQCEGMCSMLMKETGEMMFSCSYAPGSPYECFATTTRCTISRCTNALLTTPEGRVVGELACAAATAEARAERIAVAAARPAHILGAITRRVRLALAGPRAAAVDEAA